MFLLIVKADVLDYKWGKLKKYEKLLNFNYCQKLPLACSFFKLAQYLLIEKCYFISFGSLISKHAEKVISNFHHYIIGPFLNKNLQTRQKKNIF